jgi:hypothetical protein
MSVYIEFFFFEEEKKYSESDVCAVWVWVCSVRTNADFYEQGIFCHCGHSDTTFFSKFLNNSSIASKHVVVVVGILTPLEQNHNI